MATGKKKKKKLSNYELNFVEVQTVSLTQPLTEMSTRYVSWGVKAAGD